MSQKPNYDPAKIEHFERMFLGALEYASNIGLPITVVEASCRDVLGKIEGRRLLDGLRGAGAKL